MIIGIVLAPTVLRAMHTPADIMKNAVYYIRIYFLGIIPLLLYNMCAGILRAVGDSKKPLRYLLISSYINISLDCLFTIVFKMGVVGVAIASVISQIISAILICHYLININEIYKIDIKRIRIDRVKIKNILRLGIPAGFQSLMFSVTNIISQSNINKFGTDSIAAWTAYTKIGSLYFMIMSGFGISVTTFVGQNYGAGNIKRLRSGVRQGVFMAICATGIISMLFSFFGKEVLILFTKDQCVLEIGNDILHFIAPLYFTYICVDLISGTLRGMGQSIGPMIVTGFGVCFLRIMWIIYAVPRWFELKTVIASLPISWSITSVLFIIYYCAFVKKLKYADVI